MQLNQDCVRNILLTVERMEAGQSIGSSQLTKYPLLSEFDQTTIEYAVEKLHEAKYLNTVEVRALRYTGYKISGITWLGHQLLDNIRDERIWEDVKQAASQVAGASIVVLAELASKRIKKSLGLN